MTDDLLERLRAADPAPAQRVDRELHALGDLPARIGAEPVVVPFRRRPNVRRVAVGVAAAIVALALIVPLAVLRPLGGEGGPPGNTGSGPMPGDGARWIPVGTVDELGSAGIMFVPAEHAFVIGGEVVPYALDAIPFGHEERVLYCPGTGTFEGPGGARYELDGSGPRDLDWIPTRTTDDGTIEIAPSLPPTEPTIQVGPSTSGRPCQDVLGFPLEGEPGFGVPAGVRLAPIAVARPQRGTTVSGPLRIVGSADVFEATVHVRLLNAEGRSLYNAMTTATCGTGCRGTFDLTIPFDVSTEQPGTLQVYEVSAMDGSDINVVEIPVTLVPAS
jgi:hypothetical protein